MERASKSVRNLLVGVSRSAERSPLFWFLYENHDELRAATQGQRIRWPQFVEHIIEIGLTDRRGATPSTSTTRRTWLRVRAYVASERTRLPPSATSSASPRSMPSAENARPIPALASAWEIQPEIVVRPTTAPSSTALLPVASLETWPVPTGQSAPPGTFLTPVAAPQMPSTPATRVRSPEAQARIDAILGRVRAQLDESDKTLRL